MSDPVAIFALIGDGDCAFITQYAEPKRDPAFTCDLCGGELKVGCVPGDFCHGDPKAHTQLWRSGWAWKQGQNERVKEQFFKDAAADPFGADVDPEVLG
jgi:hypothetical protein